MKPLPTGRNFPAQEEAASLWTGWTWCCTRKQWNHQPSCISSSKCPFQTGRHSKQEDERKSREDLCNPNSPREDISDQNLHWNNKKRIWEAVPSSWDNEGAIRGEDGDHIPTRDQHAFHSTWEKTKILEYPSVLSRCVTKPWFLRSQSHLTTRDMLWIIQ